MTMQNCFLSYSQFLFLVLLTSLSVLYMNAILFCARPAVLYMSLEGVPTAEICPVDDGWGPDSILKRFDIQLGSCVASCSPGGSHRMLCVQF